MRLIPILIFCLLLNGCTGCQSKQSNNNLAATGLSDSLSTEQLGSIDAVVKEADNYKLTQLGYTCYKGNLEDVKKLLLNGANKKECMTDDIYEFDIVYAAVYFDKKEILQFLITKKEELNKVSDENGLTALSLACKKSDFEIASILLKGGADVDGGDIQAAVTLFVRL